MNVTSVTITNGSNGTIVRTTMILYGDHFDYSWPLLGVLGVLLIVIGLREVFFKKDSETEGEG